MVMKETKTFDKDAQKIFVKEVSDKWAEAERNHALFFVLRLGSSTETIETSECSEIYGFTPR